MRLSFFLVILSIMTFVQIVWMLTKNNPENESDIVEILKNLNLNQIETMSGMIIIAISFLILGVSLFSIGF